MSEPQHNLSADPLAETDLLRIDGKIVLVSWWVYFLLQNLDALTKDDIERRLIAALGNRMPALRNGIYMTSTALIDPDYTFSDERMIMFSTATPCIACTRASTPGMCSRVSWDQNIRKPGYFLPRDGGKHYRSAWEILLFNIDYVHRVYVESWNEYDEGSSIYAADPGPPLVYEHMQSNTDVFSTHNDPFEYINATARGAARINRRPENDAVILGIDTPTSAAVGTEAEIRVIVRNEGNARWTRCRRIWLAGVGTDRIIPIDDQAGEIPL